MVPLRTFLQPPSAPQSARVSSGVSTHSVDYDVAVATPSLEICSAPLQRLLICLELVAQGHSLVEGAGEELVHGGFQSADETGKNDGVACCAWHVAVEDSLFEAVAGFLHGAGADHVGVDFEAEDGVHGVIGVIVADGGEDAFYPGLEHFQECQRVAPGDAGALQLFCEVEQGARVEFRIACCGCQVLVLFEVLCGCAGLVAEVGGRRAQPPVVVPIRTWVRSTVMPMVSVGAGVLGTFPLNVILARSRIAVPEFAGPGPEVAGMVEVPVGVVRIVATVPPGQAPVVSFHVLVQDSMMNRTVDGAVVVPT